MSDETDMGIPYEFPSTPTTPTANTTTVAPMSHIIRGRLQANKVRHFACDNIADYMNDAEREKLIDELTEKFEDVLDTLLIDRQNDPNSMETGRRLAKMYIHEIMGGRYYSPPKATAFPNTGKTAYKGMLVIRAELKSMCSHHHQPVTGVAYIGLIPGTEVLGLSKYIRLAQHVARRGTLQEELTNTIAQTIMDATGSENVAVYIQAQHGCCENRGVMAGSSLTQTTALHGLFYNDAVRKEFFDNIQMQNSHAGNR